MTKADVLDYIAHRQGKPLGADNDRFWRKADIDWMTAL
jgi:hypothetical protein